MSKYRAKIFFYRLAHSLLHPSSGGGKAVIASLRRGVLSSDDNIDKIGKKPAVVLKQFKLKYLIVLPKAAASNQSN